MRGERRLAELAKPAIDGHMRRRRFPTGLYQHPKRLSLSWPQPQAVGGPGQRWVAPEMHASISPRRIPAMGTGVVRCGAGGLPGASCLLSQILNNQISRYLERRARRPFSLSTSIMSRKGNTTRSVREPCPAPRGPSRPRPPGTPAHTIPNSRPYRTTMVRW